MVTVAHVARSRQPSVEMNHIALPLPVTGGVSGGVRLEETRKKTDQNFSGR